MKPDEKHTRDLLLQIKKGSESAFRRLYDLYRPLINSKCKEFSSSLEPDEILQISSIGLFDAAQSYDYQKSNGRVTFGLYAEICINNRLTSELRKLRRTENLDTLLPDMPDIHSPEDALILKEDLSARLDAVEARLSEYEKSVFKLYLTGKSYRETAKMLGRTEKSVDSAMSRIRAKFKTPDNNDIIPE